MSKDLSIERPLTQLTVDHESYQPPEKLSPAVYRQISKYSYRKICVSDLCRLACNISTHLDLQHLTKQLDKSTYVIHSSFTSQLWSPVVVFLSDGHIWSFQENSNKQDMKGKTFCRVQ